MIFTWQPDAGAGTVHKPVVNTATYGGYEQRDALPVSAFLRARGGVDSFTWTPPLGSPGFYVCREWKHEHLGGGVFVVSGVFDQVMG